MTQDTEGPGQVGQMGPEVAASTSPAVAPPRTRPRWWVVALIVLGCLVVAFFGLGTAGRQAQQRQNEERQAATTFTFPAALDGLSRQDDEQTKALADGLGQAMGGFPDTTFEATAAGYGDADGKLQVAVVKASKALTQSEQDGLMQGQQRSLQENGGFSELDPGALGGAVTCGRTQAVCVVVDAAGLMMFASPGGDDVASRVGELRGQIEHRS